MILVCRHWQYDVSTESYVIVSMSVSHPCASLHASSIRATELATRYLIEPLTKDSSRLTFISRVDMRCVYVCVCVCVCVENASVDLI